jgi:aryl-alcohol dehydrogenase
MAVLSATAAITESPGSGFRLDSVELDPPGPGQVRVEIHACGVCHTDMVMEEGHLPVPFPAIFGHEGAGVVEAVGPGVTNVAPGDAVMLSFHSCGACPACDDHQPGYCREFVPRNFLGALDPGQGGVHRNGSQLGSNIFGQSAFATYALAHSDNVVKVDPLLPLALLAPLGCGIQTGAGTVMETLSLVPGDSIAVLGAGAVGLAAVMAAKIMGAGSIAVLDLHSSRLDLARELGATETASDIASLAGPYDHVLDTTGVPSLVQKAVPLLAARGTLALVGAYPPVPMELDLSAIMSMGRRIVGVVEGGIDPQTFIPRLIEYYRAGELPLEKLVRFYPFSAIEEAFEASKSGKVIKPVLTMKEPQ